MGLGKTQLGSGILGYCHTLQEVGGSYVLPPSSVPMDTPYHYAFPTFEQTPSASPSHVEPRDGGGALLCAQRGQRLAGPVDGAQGQHRPPAVARVVLRSRGEARRPAASRGGRVLLCALVAVDLK